MKHIVLLLIGGVFLLTGCTSGPAQNPSGTTHTSSVIEPRVLIPSPTYGTGKHVLMIFADFQCPACIRFSQSVAPIFEEYADKGYLTIVYKQFPLTTIHKNALRDSLSALCVAKQGKYFEYKKNLYALEQKKSGASVSDNERISAANDIGIDTNLLTECLSKEEYLPQVYAEMKEGEALKVSSTPSLFLDGKKLDLTLFPDIDTLQTVMERMIGVEKTSSSGAVLSGEKK